MSVPTAVAELELQETRTRRARQLGWLRNRTLVSGIVLLTILAAMFAAAPLLASHSPDTQDLLDVGQALVVASARYGRAGRDVGLACSTPAGSISRSGSPQ